MNEVQNREDEAKKIVIEWLNSFGLVVTNGYVLNKLVGLYVDGMSKGLDIAKEITKGGEHHA